MGRHEAIPFPTGWRGSSGGPMPRSGIGLDAYRVSGALQRSLTRTALSPSDVLTAGSDSVCSPGTGTDAYSASGSFGQLAISSSAHDPPARASRFCLLASLELPAAPRRTLTNTAGCQPHYDSPGSALLS